MFYFYLMYTLQDRNKYITTTNLTSSGIEKFVEDVVAGNLTAYSN